MLLAIGETEFMLIAAKNFADLTTRITNSLR